VTVDPDAITLRPMFHSGALRAAITSELTQTEQDPIVSKPEAVLIDIPTTAAMLSIGTTKCKELIASGELRSVTIDRRRLVPADEPAAYVARLMDRGAS
jgi:hypothetical protein